MILFQPCLQNIVYHFFRQLWLVLGVKLMETNSNLLSNHPLSDCLRFREDNLTSVTQRLRTKSSSGTKSIHKQTFKGISLTIWSLTALRNPFGVGFSFIQSGFKLPSHVIIWLATLYQGPIKRIAQNLSPIKSKHQRFAELIPCTLGLIE